MPNHFHGIIWIIAPVGERDVKIKPIPEFIGAFKTTSSKLIHRAGNEQFKWQKSYYDVIIRDNESLQRIREYIRDNPKHWAMDDYFNKHYKR
jgi:REP element-mobilizing transposase RayT